MVGDQSCELGNINVDIANVITKPRNRNYTGAIWLLKTAQLGQISAA